MPFRNVSISVNHTLYRADYLAGGYEQSSCYHYLLVKLPQTFAVKFFPLGCKLLKTTCHSIVLQERQVLWKRIPSSLLWWKTLRRIPPLGISLQTLWSLLLNNMKAPGIFIFTILRMIHLHLIFNFYSERRNNNFHWFSRIYSVRFHVLLLFIVQTIKISN